MREDAVGHGLSPNLESTIHTREQAIYVKTLITGALGAYVLLSIGAGTGAYAEPRFRLEALSFKAIDQTGYDWSGSDEVKVKNHSPHAQCPPPDCRNRHARIRQC